MPDRRVVAMRWLGSNSARCVTARIGVRTGDVEEASEKCSVLAEPRSIAVAMEHEVEVGIAGLGFEDRESPVLADYTVTFCSCLGKAPGILVVRLEVGDSPGIHHGIAAEVARSCQIVVHCQSSSFPCRLEDSWEQH